MLFVLLWLGAPINADRTQSDGQTPPTPAGTARVYGRVVTADTGGAVRMATVLLSSPSSPSWTTTTDADGRFDFTQLPAGRFTLRLAKAGFVTTTFGASPRLSQIELRAGQQLDRGDLVLPRAGVITGRIVDEFGDPVSDLSVAANRLEYTVPGVRRLASARNAQTNDLGEYRIYGLQPGNYYVSAKPEGLRGVVVNSAVTSSNRGLAPTFFPGTATASDAKPVVVTAGEVTANVSMRLLTVPLVHVAGRVVDSRGLAASTVIVMLNGARMDGAVGGTMQYGEVDAQGRFTLSSVAPGEYRLDVVSKAHLEAIAASGSSIRPVVPDEFASQPVSVMGENVDDLIIQTGRGFELTGTVVVEGAAVTPEVLKGLQVEVFPLNQGQGVSMMLQTGRVAVRPDGSFSVRGLIGTRMVRVGGLPAGLALKSVRAQGIDVTDDGLQMTQGDIPNVEIILTATPTLVTGSVSDRSGTPVREYAVIIFADDSRRWTAPFNRFVTVARPTTDGRFTVRALPSGNYLAVAMETLVEGEWAEPENLERLRAHATRFSLADGETRTLTLVRR